jgi:hypothetical protein
MFVILDGTVFNPVYFDISAVGITGDWEGKTWTMVQQETGARWRISI